MAIMNIQIFGTKKCNDTKKAQRYFKERGIKFQFIDMSEKEISKGEFRSVCQAVGGINAMINEDCKDKDALALVKYISEDEREEKILANQQVIKTPIVRNGKQATVGIVDGNISGFADNCRDHILKKRGSADKAKCSARSANRLINGYGIGGIGVDKNVTDALTGE